MGKKQALQYKMDMADSCMEEIYGPGLDRVMECIEELAGMYRSRKSMMEAGQMETEDFPEERSLSDAEDAAGEKTGGMKETAAAVGVGRIIDRTVGEKWDGWRYRYLESRYVLAEQYQCIAGMLRQIRGSICNTRDITKELEAVISRLLKSNRLVLERCVVTQRQSQRKEALLYLHTLDDICVPAREIAGLMGEATGMEWMVAAESRTIVTRHSSLIRLEESSVFFVSHGMARAVKEGEEISGDSFSFQPLPQGQWMLALCDGLGSGMQANQESRQAVELLERLLEAGFQPDTSLRMLHNTLLMEEKELRPVTMDLSIIDLHTGMADFYKTGAVASFIRHEEGAQLLQSEALPMGYLPGLEPAHYVCRLKDGDYIVMMTDGMLEALGGVDKEEKWLEFLGRLRAANPKDLANKLLIYAMAAVDGEPRDDMTVLVTGIWKK